MSSNSEVIARASVIVDSDSSSFDKAMEILPGKAKKQIKKAMDTIKAEIKATNQAIASTGGSGKQFDTLTKYQDKLSKSMDSVKTSAVHQAAALSPLSKSINGVGRGFASNGNKLQVFAQGLDDLQYVGQPGQGLRPILNNLVQISPVAGIAALAIQQVYEHWGQLSKAFGMADTRSEATKMDELAKKVHKTAEETKQLNEYTRDKNALASQSNALSEYETERSGRVGKAVAEAGQDVVAKGLVKLYRDKYMAGDKEIARLQKENEREFDLPGGSKKGLAEKTERVKARKQRIEERLLEIGKLHSARAETHEDSSRSLARDMQAHPEIFDPKTRAGFKNATPAEIEKQKHADEERQAEEFARERESRMAQLEIERDEQRKKELTDAAEKRNRMNVLADVAVGRETDRGKLAGQIGEQMKASGSTQEEIDRYAPQIADALIYRILDQTQERARNEGVSVKRAGHEEAAKEFVDSQNAAGRSTGGFSDLTSFYAKLQSSMDAKDPYQATIAAATQETAKTNGQIYRAIVERNKNGGAGLAGPA